MFSKQLLIGLGIGAASTGLGFLLLGGVPIPEPAVVDADNFKLLAQIIPNESTPITEEIKQGVVQDSSVIEVRAVSSAPTKKATVASVPVIDEPESAEELDPVIEIVQCSYVTNDKPELDGIINEIAWMGSADDSNAEWVEMINRTKEELDVSGWQLVDKAEQIRATVPSGVVLPKGGFLMFEREPHQLSGTTVLYKGALSNTDEGVRLFDADCNLQDEVIAKSKWPAGTNSPKATAERSKDLSWHTFYGVAEAGILGTPSKKNSNGPPPKPEPEEEPAAPVGGEPRSSEDEREPEPEPATPVVVPIAPGQLIISEVMVGDASGAGNEFIELYNTTEVEIDLTGFSIKKKVLSSGTESSLVTTVNFEGKKVESGARFIIGHGSFAAQSQMSWPTSYSIAYSGNAILLYNTQGEKIDEVSWDMTAGQSYGCASQGSCAVQATPNPGE